MKLLCVSPSYWPAFQFGGPVTAGHMLNKSLQSNGVSVDVFTTSVGLENKVSLNSETSLDGVKITYFEYNKRLEFLGDTGWQYSPRLKEALLRRIGDYDVVNVVGVWNYPSTVALRLCAARGIPCVVTPMGLLAPDKFVLKGWKKRLYYDLFIKAPLKKITALHYFTRPEANESVRFLDLKNKVVIIPIGVDLSTFDGLPSKAESRARYPHIANKKVFLFLGRITWIKGLDILLKAFSAAVKGRSDIHLVITGQSEAGYKDTVDKIIAEENLQEHITFTGLLPEKEKLSVLAMSDYLVLPSYSEAFSVAVLEGLAAGLPAIISDRCNFPEVATKNCGAVVKPEVQPLKETISRFADFGSARQEMSQNCRRLIRESYNWDVIAKNFIQTYQELLAR